MKGIMFVLVLFVLAVVALHSHVTTVRAQLERAATTHQHAELTDVR